MRRRVQLHALTSMLISLCVSMGAQQPQTPVQGVVVHIDVEHVGPFLWSYLLSNTCFSIVAICPA
jgi:hypothetical protein